VINGCVCQTENGGTKCRTSMHPRFEFLRLQENTSDRVDGLRGNCGRRSISFAHKLLIRPHGRTDHRIITVVTVVRRIRYQSSRRRRTDHGRSGRTVRQSTMYTADTIPPQDGQRRSPDCHLADHESSQLVETTVGGQKSPNDWLGDGGDSRD
jgi:hypothetical protein